MAHEDSDVPVDTVCVAETGTSEMDTCVGSCSQWTISGTRPPPRPDQALRRTEDPCLAPAAFVAARVVVAGVASSRLDDAAGRERLRFLAAVGRVARSRRRLLAGRGLALPLQPRGTSGSCPAPVAPARSQGPTQIRVQVA